MDVLLDRKLTRVPRWRRPRGSIAPSGVHADPSPQAASTPVGGLASY